MKRVGVLGAAGYLGGELLRLLLGHPEVTVAYAVSTRFPGRRVDAVHPNLRARTDMSFCALDELAECDALLLATPHTTTMGLLPALRAPVIIDLSGDFRLRDPDAYRRYYGVEHAAPEKLAGFVTGCPELFRAALRTADLISVPGCMATAAMLALAPLADQITSVVHIDARTGSSGAGGSPGSGPPDRQRVADLHAERSGALRVYAPAGHRHEAEVAQVTGLDVRMTATGVEAVRGVQVLCHAGGPLDDKKIRRIYRERYGDEPFVRIVAHRRGPHRLPDPKILLGSNYCDIGFAADGTGRVTLIAALDNLMKGGAGGAVQCLNIRMGWPEDLGLGFPGLHPI